MNRKPRALDLFCGAGGATRGLQLAGFHVVGVDIKPQPRYVGDAFHKADAMTFPLDGFDFIWASPPCQKYSPVNRYWQGRGREYPDLIAGTRARLQESGVEWVIENVEGAPLIHAMMLCGSSFRLPIRRHRFFEGSRLLLGPSCQHRWQEKSGVRYPTCFQQKGEPRRTSSVVQIYGHTSGVKLWPAALEIDWMNRQEMTQAIPPAYSKYIGEQMMPHVLRRMQEHAAA